MSIGVVDRKLLWGRAGNRCAWAGCNQRLLVDLRVPESALLQTHGAVIGEEAHIRSSRSEGPRHDPNYAKEKLDTYDNLLLLCPTHHATIDKGGGAAWSISALERMKADHECAIDASASTNDLLARDVQELLTAQVAVWEELVHLDGWQQLTGCLNQVHPFIRRADLDDLFSLGAWLLQRRWPPGYARVASAFEQFRRVLGCLLDLLSHNFERRSELLELPLEYKHIEWNPTRYTELISDFNVKANITWLLTIELTRSVNLVIDAVAAELDPLYRMAEGCVLMQDGDAVFGTSVLRLEYLSTELLSFPRHYSMSALMERVTVELEGGDPRRGRDIDLYAVDVAQWSRAAPGT